MTTERIRPLLRAVAQTVSPLVIALVCPAYASQLVPQQADPPRLSRDVALNAAASPWTTTDIELQPGERVVFKAGGTGRCGVDAEFGPAGMQRGFRDLLRVLPVQSGRGALIGRIGDADVGLPFAIGASGETVTAAGGILALGINRAANDNCTAAFTVHVDVFAPPNGEKTLVAKRVDLIEGVDQALLAKIPRRVRDLQGNAGDMVNFFIIGSDTAMQRVFKTAGWVNVDADVRGAIINGVLGSLSKEAYLTMPMSLLYLFDRPQDFGWAHAEPVKVVESRHHLRVWKAPMTVGGATLWTGSATHDIGFERDQRNNGVTHRIDPNIDLEREYVEKTLTRTGVVSEFTYVTPTDALREAKTATGGTFQSDGRILIMKLDESSGPNGRQ